MGNPPKKNQRIDFIFERFMIAPAGGYSTTRPRNERDVSKFDVRPVSVRVSVRLSGVAEI